MRRVLIFNHISGDDHHVLNVPPFAESVTEGDVRWEKSELSSIAVFSNSSFETVASFCVLILILFVDVGDSVAVDEVVCEIETDKVRVIFRNR